MGTEDWQTRSRLTLACAIGFSLLGLLVTLASTMMLITRSSSRRGELHMTTVNGSIRISPASSGQIPPQAASVAQSGEAALESSADQTTQSENDTTMMKTFPLVPGSKFSINNISGSIAVEAWDQQKAEVKVIKRGPDRGAQVFFANSSNNLSLRTGVPGGNDNQDVRYEVKLPSNIGRVDLKSVNGAVKLSDVNAQIFVESTNGSIELDDVVGVSRVQTSNGKINAVLAAASNGPMEFAAVNGNIDVTVKSGFDAALEASTVHGRLNIDNQFGILVQKEMAGQRARGRIGSGGQPFKLSTINGSVTLSKQL